MIIYKTGYGTNIKEFEATRMNDKSVWYLDYRGNECRSSRNSTYLCYHDSWEDAHTFLIERAENLCVGIRHQLESANGALGHVKGMKKPSEVAK